MSGDVRKKMIEGATRLLARRGLEATSFSEVLELTGAPRGSVYHHFPEGKTQLVGEALDFAGTLAIDAINRKAGAPAVEVVGNFFDVWRMVLTRSNFESGCAVLAVTVATHEPELMAHALAVFRGWHARLAELLEQGGLTKKQATAFAYTLVASAEGAVVMSRAERSLEPFEAVAKMLTDQARKLTAPKR